MINCVGFGDIASCEAQPDKAYQVNTVGARNLAVQAQAIGARLIHLSTDDVFSHHAIQPYNEFEIQPLPPFMEKVNLQEAFCTKSLYPPCYRKEAAGSTVLEEIL